MLETSILEIQMLEVRQWKVAILRQSVRQTLSRLLMERLALNGNGNYEKSDM